MARGRRSPGARWRKRDWMLAQALHEYERLLCSGCGNPIYQTMDPATEDDWDAGLPHRCFACTAVARAAKDADKHTHPSALRWGARRRSQVSLEERAKERAALAWFAEDD